MDSLLPILKQIPFFAQLTQEEHQQIINNVTMNYYPVGHVFFKEGDEAGNMYIIKNGIVKISRSDQEVATLADNNFFGEMGLVSDKPRNATATAMDECQVFELKKDDFIKLMENLPELATKVSNTYIERDKQNAQNPNEI